MRDICFILFNPLVMKFPKLLSFFCIIVFSNTLKAQPNFGFTDGRDADPTCIKAAGIIRNMPKEVLFGIDIKPSGEVYFSMSSKQWFNKLFAVANCISADIVSKDKYNCATYSYTNSLFKGYIMPPLLKLSFGQNAKARADDGVTIKLGTLPASLANKEVEGNLVIACDRKVCYYTNFVDIDRSVWRLLPMGLYADTLVQSTDVTDSLPQGGLFTYSSKVQVIVPFLKGKATFNKADLKPLYDSLNLGRYDVKKMDIVAYASVDGERAINESLVQKRAEAMTNALKELQVSVERVNILTAENWVEFFEKIKGTPLNYLSTLSKLEIKQKLKEKAVADSIENVLATERKAIVTVYLATKSLARRMPAATILGNFNQAVKDKKLPLARAIQKEILERVADNKLPEEYINKLEVPLEKDYSELINDREVYKYQLKQTPLYDALQTFERLKQLDPANGKIAYNVFALRLLQSQLEDSLENKQSLLTNIQQLVSTGIDASLVKRLLINYHIVICADYNNAGRYDDKDSALLFIRLNYDSIKLTDEDRMSLAKYFTFYSQSDWAVALLQPRVEQIDVSEDITFYYLNLQFFRPYVFDLGVFKKNILNAINLNRKRYCKLFNSVNTGGASMQLLEYKDLREAYCDNCTQ